MLNDKEMKAIQKIVDFGGYVTSMILGQYIKDSDRHLRRILCELENEKLLRRVELSRNRNEHTVFQVTKKACILCNRGDSHMRKKHTPPFAARALIRSHFLFSLAGSNYQTIFSCPAAKLEFLKEKGFEEQQLPRKFNNGVPVIQVEEHLLSGEPYSPSDGFCIVHPDKCDVTAMTQLITLLERYEKMLAKNKCSINFLAVCENGLRAREFELAGQKLIGNGRSLNGGARVCVSPVTGFSIECSYY